MKIDEFKEFLLKFWLKTNQPFTKTIFLSESDLEAIEALKTSKYQSWDWNYAESPAFEINKTMDPYSIKVKVDMGLIEELIYFDGKIDHSMKNFVKIPFDKEVYLTTVSHSGENFKMPLEAFSKVLFD